MDTKIIIEKIGQLESKLQKLKTSKNTNQQSHLNDIVSLSGEIKNLIDFSISENSFIDNAENERVENKLESNEERFRKLFEDSADATLIIEDNQFIDCNKATLKMLRMDTKEQFVVTHPSVLSPKKQPDGRESWEKAEEMMEIAFKEGSNRFEWVHKRVNGELFYAEVLLTPIEHQKKQLLYCVWRDITDRKNDEKALKSSEQRYKSLFEQAADGILIGDPNGKIADANRSITAITGYEKDDIIGKNINILFSKQILKKNPLKYDLVDAGKPVLTERQLVRKDGKIITIEMNSQKVEDGRFQTYIRDITARKQSVEETKKTNYILHDLNSQLKTQANELRVAKEKAEESEEQLKRISNNFVDGMIYQVAMLDEDKRKFNYVSDTVTRLYGCTPEQAKDNPDLIYGKLHPDDISGLIEKEKEALQNMSVFRTECRVMNPDGSIRWSYYVSQPRIINGIVCWDGIEVDISKQKNIEKELIIAKEKAEESDRLKSAFLANMSHEIRTPMNGILGFAELLKTPELSGDTKNQYIDIIDQSGNRMLNIINDLIDISKIEAGQIDIHFETFNINALLSDLYTFFLPEANKKNLHLDINCMLPDNKSFIRTDKTKLSQVLTNLIKNAIKFTDEGKINISYTHENKYIEFCINDTGIGIEPEIQKIIFERFRQAELEVHSPYEGAGLGLSISKAYVEMLGGKIWTESKHGEGSRFKFTLPFNKDDQKTKPSKVQEATIDEHANHLKILIVDDDEISRYFITEALKNESIEFLQAKDGQEAIDCIKHNDDIDLVLMDIKMPNIDGYKATKLIKQIMPDLVIIAQTANALDMDREKALKAGCDDYISKPIKRLELKKIINKHILNS